MKSYNNPPEPVRLVCEAICFSLQVDQYIPWVRVSLDTFEKY